MRGGEGWRGEREKRREGERGEGGREGQRERGRMPKSGMNGEHCSRECKTKPYNHIGRR